MHASRFATLAAIIGALAVAAGAFGAHGLKDLVPESHLAWWQTGSHYHLVHAVVLFLASALPPRCAKAQKVSIWALLIGIFIFSGSLYAMTLSGIRILGAITPIGGVSLIFGWLALAAAHAPRKGTDDAV